MFLIVVDDLQQSHAVTVSLQDFELQFDVRGGFLGKELKIVCGSKKFGSTDLPSFDVLQTTDIRAKASFKEV